MTTVHRFLDTMCVRHLSTRMADKLTKDISKSAVRKAGRTGSRTTAFSSICKTAAIGSINSSVALLVADLVTLLAEYLAYHYRQLRLLPHKDYHPVDLWKRTGKVLINNVACYGCFVAGSCVGTLVWPGTGTLIGGLIGDLVIYVI